MSSADAVPISSVPTISTFFNEPDYFCCTEPAWHKSTPKSSARITVLLKMLALFNLEFLQLNWAELYLPSICVL
jgi:hypothetical protein